MKKVIYSHIPEEERLGTDVFDDLLSKKTSNNQEKIKIIKSIIDEKILNFVDLYNKSRNDYITELKKKLVDKKMLEELDKSKPLVVTNPLEDSGEGGRDFKLGKISKKLNERKDIYHEEVENLTSSLKMKKSDSTNSKKWIVEK